MALVTIQFDASHPVFKKDPEVQLMMMLHMAEKTIAKEKPWNWVILDSGWSFKHPISHNGSDVGFVNIGGCKD